MVLRCKPNCAAPRFESTSQSPHSLSPQGLKAMGFLACLSNCPLCLQLTLQTVLSSLPGKPFATVLSLNQLFLILQGSTQCPFSGKPSPSANLGCAHLPPRALSAPWSCSPKPDSSPTKPCLSYSVYSQYQCIEATQPGGI